MLNPRDAWDDKEAFEHRAAKLRDMYVEKWKDFSQDPFMERLGNFGPGGNAL